MSPRIRPSEKDAYKRALARAEAHKSAVEALLSAIAGLAPSAARGWATWPAPASRKDGAR